MENDPMCRICYKPAVISQSIINTKEINGVQVGQNNYYCSQACRYEDKRKFFKSAGLIFLFIGFILILFKIVLGTVIFILGSISVGYAIFLYPKKEEKYTSNEPDSLSFSEREELAIVIQNATNNSDSGDFDDELLPGEVSQMNPDTPPRVNPTNSKQVYSEILENYVDPCCYQTARLLDKYCMCGKAMEYISKE